MGVVILTKVLGHAKSQSPRTLRVLGPLQKLLLPFKFRVSVPLHPQICSPSYGPALTNTAWFLLSELARPPTN